MKAPREIWLPSRDTVPWSVIGTDDFVPSICPLSYALISWVDIAGFGPLVCELTVNCPGATPLISSSPVDVRLIWACIGMEKSPNNRCDKVEKLFSLPGPDGDMCRCRAGTAVSVTSAATCSPDFRVIPVAELASVVPAKNVMGK